MDSLPPRSAQPILNYTSQFQGGFAASFDPQSVMKMLARLNHIYSVLNERTDSGGKGNQKPNLKGFHRDTYVCKWLGKNKRPKSLKGIQHFPVFVRGASRQSLFEDNNNLMYIGILHIPLQDSDVNHLDGKAMSSFTILPPDPHIVLPLILKIAEIEYRIAKRQFDRKDSTAFVMRQSSYESSRPISVDEKWRNEFKAYLQRVPPYYQQAMRKCLRPLLPIAVHALLVTESIDVMASQCFSRVCYQKIRNGEAMMRDHNERQENQERDLLRNRNPVSEQEGNVSDVGYGQYDPRGSISSYLASLRSLPCPGKVPSKKSGKIHVQLTKDKKPSVIDT